MNFLKISQSLPNLGNNYREMGRMKLFPKLRNNLNIEELEQGLSEDPTNKCKKDG